MSPLALTLLLAAAVLHAGWNLIAKRAADRQALLWWAMLVAGLALSPAVAMAWPPRPEALALALGASSFEVLYYLALAAAYEVGDFSLVYPVARGSAPLLIALLATLLLGERPSLAGWSGIGLLVAGLLLAAAPSARLSSVRQPPLALVLAVATGLCIAAYSAILKLGVGYLQPVAMSSIFHLGTTLLMAPLVWRRGRKVLEVLRAAPGTVASTGAMLGGASALVLSALAIEPASYVGAVREISVIVGALAGWRLLGEPMGARRTAAAAIMFGGMATIAVAG